VNTYGSTAPHRTAVSSVRTAVVSSRRPATARYGRKAREKVLTKEEAASLLARRPYDLRHAGVSFWLRSDVDPMECARRAGHTIAVLFRVYAKVLAQTQERANRRIEAALQEWNEPE
jgi:hypothetical protein